ncbi:hypothetical protein WR25_08719 [Diploscapter pachys]|uniref:F-box domain-containing protein n=1 Tax=Diploscapter pachys TaxID=2018661 RepID=A0A2A2L0M7_9BILA|nr:hypothetical protein WR25_08719 [Diploscapter pachys]
MVSYLSYPPYTVRLRAVTPYRSVRDSSPPPISFRDDPAFKSTAVSSRLSSIMMSESVPAKRFPTPTPISTRSIEPPKIPTVRKDDPPPPLSEPAKVEPPLAPMPVRKKKVVVKKVVKKVKKSASTTENDASSVPSIFKSRPPIIPNLPDVVMRKIFSMLTYKELCGIESVCRRWMNIMNTQWRKQIHEICIERLGSKYPTATQCIAFRRLNVSCPSNSFDFLAGVFRRSCLGLLKMTTDIHFLAYMSQVHIKKGAERRYFSMVEELWLLIIDCTDELTANFLEVIPKLFSELTHLTLQIHVNPQYCENVGRIVKRLVQEYPKTEINLELHADKSHMVLAQVAYLPSLPLTKIKVICTDFNLPQIRLDILYGVLKEKNIMAKNITIRDWTIYADGSTPLTYHPLDTFRISSCTIQTVDDFISSLKLTSTQNRPKKIVKKLVKRKKLPDDEANRANPDEPKKKKIVKKLVKKSSEPYIKKLEVAGQCVIQGYQFLQNRAHTELEKRLNTSIPEMNVDCSEIYYCW